MCLGYLHKSQKRVLGSSYSFEGGSLPESGICIFLKNYIGNQLVSETLLSPFPTEEKGSRHTGPLVCSVGGGT